MSIKDFEMFHGAVLTKLVRSDNPITLRMIETNLKEAWSAYTLNDEVILYIKYSTKPQQRKKNEDVLIWIFSFSTAHLGELQNLRKRKAVYMTLVCGQRAIDDPNMYVCLITPDEIAQCIDIQAIQQQTINVRYEPRKKLRVWGGVNTVENPVLVASRKLEDWNVPGN